jgi:3',5'-cyclic AMP phosphodiesterase CpdA
VIAQLGRPAPLVPGPIDRAVRLALREIQEGRLAYTFSVLAAFAALASGFEAYAQHRRGAFDDWLMWTPVVLTPPMVLASIASLVNRRASRALLPWLSAAMAIDGIVGFVEHAKGVARLPGGYQLAVYNITMGPPIFAPLFFLSVGFLGWLASLLRPERLRGL